MATSVRQSILNRPRRGPSNSNQQNIDKEYERELARLRAKQEQRQIYEDSIRMSVEPVFMDKIRQQEELKTSMEVQLREKEEKKRQEVRMDMESHHYNIHADKFSDVNWQKREAEKQAEKRDYLRSLMEENKKIVALKNEVERKQKEREAEDDRLAQHQGTFHRRHFL